MTTKVNKNSFRARVEALIEATAQAQPPNARALILSVFGDSVSTHGGVIWLGSLIRLVKPFGINQRLVRTSVFRLGEREILQSKQVGRRSYYSLTERGLRQFNHAADRIYRHEKAAWDGEWRLVFTNLDKIGAKRREAFQKELGWLGFSRLSNGIYGHPTVDIDEVREVVGDMKLEDSIVLMEAGNRNGDPLGASRKLVRHAFSFDATDDGYRGFIDDFEGFLDTAANPAPGDDECCFLLRTLLIHRFRLILRQEPELPLELVPIDSPGRRARGLTARIYHRIADAAERHFLAVGECEQGALPPVNEEYLSRFQGYQPA